MADMTVYVKEAINKQPIQTLEAILMQMGGIERALVDIQDGEVKISFNETQVTQEQIKNRIQQYGLHILE
ncbi:hypothetical protein [Bacillus xiapuensis]|uniref:HMA domain-containing protein n=1 Tax=Bacillus xiapuensis TaxID=2014075 RepID=A0ABU6NA66_9BACI|nr:hypothetical protein [Bacillus xiapuensis]